MTVILTNDEITIWHLSHDGGGDLFAPRSWPGHARPHSHHDRCNRRRPRRDMLHDAVARRRVWHGRAYCLARRSRLCADPGANPVRRAGCIRHLSRTPTPRMTDGYPTGASEIGYML